VANAPSRLSQPISLDSLPATVSGESWVLVDDQGLGIGKGCHLLDHRYRVMLRYLDRVRSRNVFDHWDVHWVRHWTVDRDGHGLGYLHGIGLRHRDGNWTIYGHGDLGQEIK
jgi:hypothetical protein